MRRVAARLAVAVFAVGMFAGAAQAQTPEGGMDWGFTAGVNVATWSGSDAEDAEWRTDFMGGLSVNFGISDMLSLQPELLYSRKGVKGSEAGFTGEIKLGYIDVPVLVKFATGTGQQMRPAFFFGPYVGFLLSCDASITGFGSGDCKDEVKSTDFGVIGGVGFDVGPYGIFVRFQQGLTKLDDSGDDSTLYNRVVTIGGRVSVPGLGRR
jgi:hypothetical protein